MLTRPFDSPRRAASSACLLLLLAAPLAAAPQGDAPKAPAAPASSADRSALRRDIERLYEVLPTHDGLLLRPRAERVGVRTIEISGDEIAVNGNRLSAAVLREWLGAAQADPVIRLAELDPASRRALFDLKRTDATPAPGSAPSAAPAPGSPPAPPAPQAAASPDDDTEVQGTAGDQGDDNAGAQGSEMAEEESPSPRAHRRHGSSGSIVRFAGSVTVGPGENPEEVTAIGGSIQVDGDVAGDVVAVGGSCTINGKVAGSVTAVGGSVRLGPQAEVGGDVVSVVGTVDKADTARVHGSISAVSALEMFGNRGGHYSPGVTYSPFAGVGRLVETLTKILLLALLASLVLLVARPTVERVAMRVAAEPGRAGLTGLLCQLAFLPLFVVITILLVLTIIGCALLLLYPFLFIALLLAGLLGYTAVAYRVGHWAEERFGWHYASPYVMVLTGVALIEFLPFVGRILGVVPFLHPLGFAARVAGFVIEYVAWTIGFGAVTLDFLATGGLRRFRRGAEPSPVLPAPAPPVAPPAPEPPPTPQDPWETR